MSVLLAVVDTGSVDRYFVPEEAGMRYCTQPVAMRIRGGHTTHHQVFLEEYRMNCRMSEIMRNSLPGLFHVTTPAGWDQIALDGQVVAGIDLNYGGRYDIHMMVSPPYPDDLAVSERLLKGPRKTEYVVMSINPAGLQMGDARINQQGYVLQRTPTDWRHLDYALRLLPVHGGYDVE